MLGDDVGACRFCLNVHVLVDCVCVVVRGFQWR